MERRTNPKRQKKKKKGILAFNSNLYLNTMSSGIVTDKNFFIFFLHKRHLIYNFNYFYFFFNNLSLFPPPTPSPSTHMVFNHHSLERFTEAAF